MSDIMKTAAYAQSRPMSPAMPDTEDTPRSNGVLIEKVGNGYALSPHPHYGRQTDRIMVAVSLDDALSLARKQLQEI